MAERTGTTITCDRWIGGSMTQGGHTCHMNIHADTRERAREQARERGWTRTDDGRDFCGSCSEVRAARKKPADLMPDGVRVMRVFDACDAAGFERRAHGDEEEGEAHFYHCGQEVEYSHLFGSPYRAECKVCGVAIADILGPAFTKGAVSFPDPDKVDVEDLRSWVIVAEAEAAIEATS